MLHRHAEVKFRDNQENRVQHFPKTPKQGSGTTAQASKFVTPAPRPRVALGAKSTNVHHRQFTSIKTGKRHSPVAACKPSLAVPPPEQVQALSGGAALRAALTSALATGIDVPDVEYAPPPPLEELPYAEPEGMEPMDWEAFRMLRDRGEFRREEIRLKPKFDSYMDPPPFKFINVSPRQPSTSQSTQKRSIPSKIGGFAAPTAAARAKVRAPVSSSRPGKENSNSLSAGSHIALRPSVPRSKSTGPQPAKGLESLGKLSIGEPEPLRPKSLSFSFVPDVEPLPLMEVDYDLSEDEFP